MAVHKLDSVDAFVVRDFEPDVAAIGIVRSARKILQGGAKELARAQTYQCAIFNMRIGGASAGINAEEDDRPDAIDRFVSELQPQVASGSLMLDAGKGVEPASLEGLTTSDPRSGALSRRVDGVANGSQLTALSAVIGAATARPLDGARVAIEHFATCGVPLVKRLGDQGAKVVAISTSAGAITNPSGFDPSALADAARAHGEDMINSLGESGPAWQVLAAETDVLFVGSKMGVLSHTNANQIGADLIVPIGPIPYTTKGALMLEANGTVVLPDFVTTSGPLFGGMPPGGDDQESIEEAVSAQVGSLTGAVLAGERSPILEACARAESFLASWREELPFGRPFAP